MYIYLVDFVKCIIFSLPNEFKVSKKYSTICSELNVTMFGLTSEIEVSISDSYVCICHFPLICS